MAVRKKKIVFTGAPSSGKSSTMQAVMGRSEDWVVVPEAATLLLTGHYPPPEIGNIAQVRIFEKIILQLQTSLEKMFDCKFPAAKGLIMDRANLDGAAFWPPGPTAFLKEFKISPAREFKKYDAVIFFETPKEKYFGGMGIKRFHNYEQSVEAGKILHKVWHKHPNFIVVPNNDDFSEKVDHAVKIIGRVAGF